MHCHRGLQLAVRPAQSVKVWKMLLSDNIQLVPYSGILSYVILISRTLAYSVNIGIASTRSMAISLYLRRIMLLYNSDALILKTSQDFELLYQFGRGNLTLAVVVVYKVDERRRKLPR